MKLINELSNEQKYNCREEYKNIIHINRIERQNGCNCEKTYRKIKTNFKRKYNLYRADNTIKSGKRLISDTQMWNYLNMDLWYVRKPTPPYISELKSKLEKKN
jgi:hypothetical protein